MKTRIATSLLLLALAAGTAGAEWEYNDYETIVGPWHTAQYSDWWIKSRVIASQPLHSPEGTVKSQLTFNIRAGGTEVQPNIISGLQTVEETEVAVAEWLWTASPETAPESTHMLGRQELTHTPEGVAIVGVPQGNTYKGRYQVEGASIWWQCASLTEDYETITGSGSRSGLVCSDYVDCQANGTTDIMPHAGYGEPTGPDDFALVCVEDAFRMTWGKVNATVESAGSFDATTAVTNPLSEIKLGALGGAAKYDAYYVVSCTL